MQWECVVFNNGIIEEPIPNRYLWHGGYSVAHARGSMIQYLKGIFERIQTELDIPVLCVIPCTDGDLNREHLAEYIERSKMNGQILILGTLGQRFEDAIDEDIRYLYLPLDDQFFDNGMDSFLVDAEKNPWSSRISKAVWRGNCSGLGTETVRIRTTAALIDVPEIADVRLGWWWSENKGIPSHFFGNRMEVHEMMKYKILLIIDGNVIASSHMWSFASGAVPLLISNSRCWFQDFLVPYVHYIPITYDLSDLQEKIHWVFDNDWEARQIAEKAMDFARYYFSPYIQREYLSNMICSIVGTSPFVSPVNSIQGSPQVSPIPSPDKILSNNSLNPFFNDSSNNTNSSSDNVSIPENTSTLDIGFERREE